MDVERSERRVRVTGRVETRLELACGRCLEPFEIPVDAQLRAPLRAAVGERRRGRAGDRGRRLTTAFYRDGVLDISELLREQFQLALPMKPLCSEACRGLCAQCGTNLNRTACELHAGVGRSPAGAAQEFAEPTKEN